MANFEFKQSGTLGGILPWSYRFRGSSASSEATLATAYTSAATALWNTTTNGLKNFCSADVVATKTTVATLNASMHWVTATDTAMSVTGIDANASLPWNIAEVVTLRSAGRTKSSHGRIFLPAFAEDQVVAHIIIAATTAKMKIVFDAFWTAIGVAGVIPFVVNMKPLKNGTPAFTTQSFISYDISDKPAQQRRRVSKIVPTRVTGAIP